MKSVQEILAGLGLAQQVLSISQASDHAMYLAAGVSAKAIRNTQRKYAFSISAVNAAVEELQRLHSQINPGETESCG